MDIDNACAFAIVTFTDGSRAVLNLEQWARLNDDVVREVKLVGSERKEARS